MALALCLRFSTLHPNSLDRISHHARCVIIPHYTLVCTSTIGLISICRCSNETATILAIQRARTYDCTETYARSRSAAAREAHEGEGMSCSGDTGHNSNDCFSKVLGFFKTWHIYVLVLRESLFMLFLTTAID